MNVRSWIKMSDEVSIKNHLARIRLSDMYPWERHDPGWAKTEKIIFRFFFEKYFSKTIFRKTFFKKYFSKNIFQKIFFEKYFSKTIFPKIFFETYVQKILFSRQLPMKSNETFRTFF